MKNKAAQELGRLGGRVSSIAKIKAAKSNGKKGGRPRTTMTILDIAVNLRNLIDYYNTEVITNPAEHIKYEDAAAFMFGVDEK